MKKAALFVVIFFLSFYNCSIVFALQDDDNEIMLTEYKVDITGDGKEETILLKGIPYEEGAAYLKEITLQINHSNGEEEKIALGGGYEPEIVFVDLNQNGVEDLLISIPSGGSGGMTNYYLYTYEDTKLKELALPESLNITSQFLDNYQASIMIDNTGQTYHFNLRERQKDYERLGIYYKGKLNEPRELIIDPYNTFKPIKVNENTNGLKAIQQVSGAYRADGIAFIESKWVYEKNKWKLLDVKVIERAAERKKK